jgi:hypothetical protein
MANRRYNIQVANDRACMAKGGSTSKYHTTKEGKKAKKGLWYNIAMKRKRGEKMRKKGARRVHLQKLQLKNHKRNV